MHELSRLLERFGNRVPEPSTAEYSSLGRKLERREEKGTVYAILLLLHKNEALDTQLWNAVKRSRDCSWMRDDFTYFQENDLLTKPNLLRILTAQNPEEASWLLRNLHQHGTPVRYHGSLLKCSDPIRAIVHLNHLKETAKLTPVTALLMLNHPEQGMRINDIMDWMDEKHILSPENLNKVDTCTDIAKLHEELVENPCQETEEQPYQAIFDAAILSLHVQTQKMLLQTWQMQKRTRRQRQESNDSVDSVDSFLATKENKLG